MTEAIRGTAVHYVPFRLITKDGGYSEALLHAIPRKNRNSIDIVGAFVVVQDNTLHRKIEGLLDIISRNPRDLIDSSRAIIIGKFI